MQNTSQIIGMQNTSQITIFDAILKKRRRSGVLLPESFSVPDQPVLLEQMQTPITHLPSATPYHYTRSPAGLILA